MKRKILSPIPSNLSKARVLSIRWVFALEFDINANILHPIVYSRLLEKLSEESKNPMNWTEEECLNFIIEIAAPTRDLSNHQIVLQ